MSDVQFSAIRSCDVHRDGHEIRGFHGAIHDHRYSIRHGVQRIRDQRVHDFRVHEIRDVTLHRHGGGRNGGRRDQSGENLFRELCPSAISFHNRHLYRIPKNCDRRAWPNERHVYLHHGENHDRRDWNGRDLTTI